MTQLATIDQHLIDQINDIFENKWAVWLMAGAPELFLPLKKLECLGKFLTKEQAVIFKMIKIIELNLGRPFYVIVEEIT